MATIVTREEYLASRAEGRRVSFHALKDFAHNGKEFHLRQIGELPQPPESREMFIGTAAHTLILEGREKYRDAYEVADGPVNPKTGKPYGNDTKVFRDWFAMQTKPVITTDEAALIEAMRDAVAAHGVASQLLADGIAETPIFFDWFGTPCQSQVDWISKSWGIIDLKTTADLDRFVWTARDARYINQLAFYRRAVGELFGESMDCFIVAVEKARNPRCGVFAIPKPDLDEAEDWCIQQIAALAEAEATGVWRDGYEGLRQLTLRNI